MINVGSLATRLLAVDVPAVTDGEEVNLVPANIEGVDDAIVTDTQPVVGAARYAIVRIFAKSLAHGVDSYLDSVTDVFRQLQESCIETRIILKTEVEPMKFNHEFR